MMHPVVRIIADQPVRYSLNNGYSMTQYEPGVTYQVPPFVAYGMVARGWAELIPPAELAKLAQEEDKPPEPKAAEPEAPPKSGDEGEEIKRKKAR